eukprot:m.36809 g.36809  ORF g.36809 m.36809 type:complete len:403 (+) comp32282_c0_seq6:1062-2270(+)
MSVHHWAKYYSSPHPKKILNVISLEFSQTELSEHVTAPQCVRDLDWLNLYWPENADDCPFVRPEVQKYCLMSVAGSYTDFHVDFGGTSVWYHILKGEKIFYLIQPTPKNLVAYEKWAKLPTSSELFFGEMADRCYKCQLKAGQTLFIPTGWIHAVLTPVDSLVFGGNFLHRYNIGLQVKIYEMERRLQMPNRFRHPSYETLHWYAAQHLLDDLSGFQEGGQSAPSYLTTGLQTLAETLQAWLKADSPNAEEHRGQVPDPVAPKLLIKDIFCELKQGQKSPSKSLAKSTRSPIKLTISKSVTQGLMSDFSIGKKSPSPSEMQLQLTNGKIVKKTAKLKQSPLGPKPLKLRLSGINTLQSLIFVCVGETVNCSEWFFCKYCFFYRGAFIFSCAWRKEGSTVFPS